MSRTSPFKTLTLHRVNGRESPPMTRILLRQRARQIETREQFEAIVAQAAHPQAVRRLLEPLLRQNLPCCQHALLGRTDHTADCPTVQEVSTWTS